MFSLSNKDNIIFLAENIALSGVCMKGEILCPSININHNKETLTIFLFKFFNLYLFRLIQQTTDIFFFLFFLENRI